MKETIKKSIIWWVAFSLTVMIVWVTYAAFVNINTVNNWETLSSTLMNNIINNQKDLDTRLWLINSVPSWAIIAFNSSSCPTWWSKANGTDNALDLRWEFIRGWDDGKWVDAGRWLASNQNSSEVAVDYWPNAVLPISNVVNADYSITYSRSYREVTGAWSTSNINLPYSWIRPRNVALLYCVKD